MRLRPVVRAPQRLDSDLFYLPLSRRTLRKDNDSSSSNCIEYNPNLPPAAFPTLETPRVPTSNKQKHKHAGNIFRAVEGNIHDTIADDKETDVDFEGIPAHVIEKYAASNGKFNKVYVENMKLATADQDLSLSNMDMEESDQEEAALGNCEQERQAVRVIHSPTWSEISPQLQVEICENLLQSCSWPSICRKLGLSEEEYETAQDLQRCRMRQISLEDSQLRDMREKQLRELLKIDNSSWKCNRNPHHLVFRKISRRTSHILQNDTDLDFFTCNSQDLSNARWFLNKRGIDEALAGNWSGNVICLSTSLSGSDLEVAEFDESIEDKLYTATAGSIPEENLWTVNLSDNDGTKPFYGEPTINSTENGDAANLLGSQNLELSAQLIARISEDSRNRSIMVHSLHTDAGAPAESSESATIHPSRLYYEGRMQSGYIQENRHPALPSRYISRAVSRGNLGRNPLISHRNRCYNPIPLNYTPRPAYPTARQAQTLQTQASQTQTSQSQSSQAHALGEDRQKLCEEGNLYDSSSESDRIASHFDTSPPTTPELALYPEISESRLFTFLSMNPCEVARLIDNSGEPLNSPITSPISELFDSAGMDNVGEALVEVEHLPDSGYEDIEEHNKEGDDYDEDETGPGDEEMILLPGG